MKVYLTNNNDVTISINEALNAPIENTLEETGLDLNAAVGCMIWIDSTTGEISATTYDNGEMIPATIEASDAEKTTLKSFAESLYS